MVVAQKEKEFVIASQVNEPGFYVWAKDPKALQIRSDSDAIDQNLWLWGINGKRPLIEFIFPQYKFRQMVPNLLVYPSRRHFTDGIHSYHVNGYNLDTQPEMYETITTPGREYWSLSMEQKVKEPDTYRRVHKTRWPSQDSWMGDWYLYVEDYKPKPRERSDRDDDEVENALVQTPKEQVRMFPDYDGSLQLKMTGTPPAYLEDPPWGRQWFGRIWIKGENPSPVVRAAVDYLNEEIEKVGAPLWREV